MPPDPSAPRWKKAVCPICFDLGFADSAVWGHVENDEVSSERPLTQVHHESGGGAPGSLDMTGPKELENNSMIMADTMTHTDDGHAEKVYMALVGSDTVEPGVRSILLDSRRPTSDEDFFTFLPRARNIRNKRIPFEYWLEQPCPARRNDQDAPCVAIRRGLHEYLMKTRSEYAAKQGMLRDLGYVEQGMNCGSFRLGHPSTEVEAKDGTITQEPAVVWAVESFTHDDIPSPWRMPWFPDSGLVLCKRPLTSGDTASDAAFQTATRWFETCVTSHPRCAVGDMPELPERVIAIGSADDPDSVKLVSGAGRKARYACLSHCWGPETPCTTISNVQRHQEMIPWDFLSPTFQDAIVFLRNFSRWHKEHHGEAIRYIWIDSLCIMQDSGDDWKKQTVQMHDIYSNSHVTLMGSYAHEEAKRLFGKTAADRTPKRISVEDATGRQRDLYLRNPISHPESVADSSVPPIWTRAWVLQERLLSPRLLVFGSEELSWQCSECNQCECGLDQAKVDGYLRMRSSQGTTAELLQPTSRKMLDLVLDKDPTPAKFRAAWRLVLELYSGLNLTKPDDILAAIAGLAQSFNKQLGGLEYSAGLWYEEPATAEIPNRETMLDLLWRLQYRRDARRDEARTPIIDATWSWAHPQAPIVYPFIQDELIGQYAIVGRIGAAINVPTLPENSDEIAKRAWLHNMYTDAPPSGMTLLGRLWPTELSSMTVALSAERTEDREFSYHLGEPVSDSAGAGQPLDVTLALVLPPSEESDVSVQARTRKMPPIAFYPDNLRTVVDGPLFCLALGEFLHRPVKRNLKEMFMFVGLVLEAVGHIAGPEEYDADLSKRKTEELVFRRLGLAYTPYGGWGMPHEEIVGTVPMEMVRIV